MGLRRGVEFLAEPVRKKITGYQHKGWFRQCLSHALQSRSEQHPTAVPSVSAEAAVTRAVEHCAPLFRLPGGEVIDKRRIRHRVEMQVGHNEYAPGSRL